MPSFTYTLIGGPRHGDSVSGIPYDWDRFGVSVVDPMKPTEMQMVHYVPCGEVDGKLSAKWEPDWITWPKDGEAKLDYDPFAQTYTLHGISPELMASEVERLLGFKPKDGHKLHVRVLVSAEQ